jgi:hypothetical protein
MKKWISRAAVVVLALALLAPMGFAQEEHGEVGVFANYLRFHNLDNQHFWGLGGRVAFNLSSWAQLEGGMSYNFERNFTTGTPGVTGTFSRTGFRTLDALFGPKFQTGAGPVRVFAVTKVGLINFSLTNKGVASGFVDAVSNVPDGNTHFAVYPGGGVELFAHWIGVRAELGDEIYWEGGAHHNLRFTFGPQFRF